MRVLGAIIAGGASRRMGQNKAQMPWRGKPLIEHVVARLRPQTDALVVNANDDGFGFLGLPVVPDTQSTHTPLAGLHAVLEHAQSHGFEAVLTSPCDTPLLPPDLRARLEGPAPAIAVSGGQRHHLTGFWPVALLPRLEAAMDEGMIRLMDWGALCDARPVEWLGPDPFININTPEDFQRLSDLP